MDKIAVQGEEKISKVKKYEGNNICLWNFRKKSDWLIIFRGRKKEKQAVAMGFFYKLEDA